MASLPVASRADVLVLSSEDEEETEPRPSHRLPTAARKSFEEDTEPRPTGCSQVGAEQSPSHRLPTTTKENGISDTAGVLSGTSRGSRSNHRQLTPDAVADCLLPQRVSSCSSARQHENGPLSPQQINSSLLTQRVGSCLLREQGNSSGHGRNGGEIICLSPSPEKRRRGDVTALSPPQGKAPADVTTCSPPLPGPLATQLLQGGSEARAPVIVLSPTPQKTFCFPPHSSTEAGNAETAVANAGNPDPAGYRGAVQRAAAGCSVDFLGTAAEGGRHVNNTAGILTQDGSAAAISVAAQPLPSAAAAAAEVAAAIAAAAALREDTRARQLDGEQRSAKGVVSPTTSKVADLWSSYSKTTLVFHCTTAPAVRMDASRCATTFSSGRGEKAGGEGATEQENVSNHRGFESTRVWTQNTEAIQGVSEPGGTECSNPQQAVARWRIRSHQSGGWSGGGSSEDGWFQSGLEGDYRSRSLVHLSCGQSEEGDGEGGLFECRNVGRMETGNASGSGNQSGNGIPVEIEGGWKRRKGGAGVSCEENAQEDEKEEEEVEEEERRRRRVRRTQQSDAEKTRRANEKEARRVAKAAAAAARKAEMEAAAFERVSTAAERNVTILDGAMEEGVREAIIHCLNERGYPFKCAPLPNPSSICWDLQVSPSGDIQRLPFSVLIMSLSSFEAHVKEGRAETMLQRAAENFQRVILGSGTGSNGSSESKSGQMTLLVVCQPTQQRRSKPKLSDALELALSSLPLLLPSLQLRVCADVWQAAQHVAGMHRIVAEAQYRPSFSRLHLVANAGAIRSRDPFFEHVKSNTWALMLASIPGLSCRDALAIAKVHPSLLALHRAYEAAPEASKELLLADLEKPSLQQLARESHTALVGMSGEGQVDSRGGKVDRLGKVASTRVFNAFQGKDPHYA